MLQNKRPIFKILPLAFFLFICLVTSLTAARAQPQNIPEFTASIIDAIDIDLTGHIIVIVSRGRFYPTPDYYCGSFEMLIYEAIVIHPAGGLVTSLEIGIPAVQFGDGLIPNVEVLPGTRFEVLYVLDCVSRGLSDNPRQLVLELKKF